ncbi:MAG: glycosyltransferase family 2 protein [Thiothrix sp.]|nr:glycosyltransferase family 2 protein [Thiothrix sp.]HPE60029.1 glycosyltransferase family 2 protein [Thiolinea sp.]
MHLTRPFSHLLFRECRRRLQPRPVDDAPAWVLPLSCRPGWYMLEWCAHLPVQHAILLLTPDQGRINLSADQGSLPFRSGSLAKRILYLTQPAIAWQLALESMDVPAAGTDLQQAITVDWLRVIPLRQGFAISRMLKRLGQEQAVVARRAEAEQETFAAFLYQAYNRSFARESRDQDLYELWQERVETGLFGQADADWSVLQPGSVHSHSHDAILHLAADYRAHPQAQTLLQQVLDADSDVVLVYPDEDDLDMTGRRSNPYFKPDWNPDLFFSRDYITACCIYRRSWYEQHRALFDSLGERMALNTLLPGLQPHQVRRIPLVLAHRLVSDREPGSDSRFDAERAAVLAAGLPAGVTLEPGLLPDSLRVRFPVPEPAPLVSLLVPTRDGLEVLRPCVESILAHTTYRHYEILILDNQSCEPATLAWLEQIVADVRVRVIPYDRPFNYSAINNHGVARARGSLIGLINNDVEVISPDWLTEMVSHALRPEIGCVGAKLYYSNGQIQHAGVILGLGHVAGHAHRFLARDADGYQGRLKLVQNYAAVTAACLLVRRAVYEQVGGLEERYLTVAYNDVDFCLRVRAAGYRNLWTPYAELYHHESISRGEDDTPEKKARFEREVAYMRRVWGDELDHDPCYHPCLTRRGEDFAIREFL